MIGVRRTPQRLHLQFVLLPGWNPPFLPVPSPTQYRASSRSDHDSGERVHTHAEERTRNCLSGHGGETFRSRALGRSTKNKPHLFLPLAMTPRSHSECQIRPTCVGLFV